MEDHHIKAVSSNHDIRDTPKQGSSVYLDMNRLRNIGVSKTSGTPKMDDENNGKPYEQMDDLGGKPPIFGNIHLHTL